jgi:hypothetical protein
MPLTIRRRLVDRTRQWRKVAYVVCAGLVLLAGAVVFLSVSSPASSVEVATASTFFDAGRALRTAEEMASYYDERYINSKDAEGAVNWLVDKLSTLGISVENVTKDEFSAQLGDQNLTFRNVAVVLPGSTEETILITAPRDTPSIAKVNLLQYASGTAIITDLAQVFASRPHQKTLIFLSTESSNNGGLCIRRFLDTYESAANISTILSLEGLGKEETKSLKVDVTGSQKTTPGWYLQLADSVLAESGIDIDVPGILSQAADQALSLSRGDQVAGLDSGIASLTLHDDTAANPTDAGLATQGAAIETLILSLDGGTQAPADPGTALLFESGRFLTNRAINLLAVLMVFPTAALLVIWLTVSRITVRVVLLHLRNLLSFALPLAWIFLLAWILSKAGLIPRYSFHVPTESGPATSPSIVPIVLLLVLGGAAFIGSRRYLGYLRPREPRATTEMSRLTVGFFGLLIGLIFMLIRSPFLMLPCVILAWTWPLATCFAEPVSRGTMLRLRFASNAPVLLVGLIAPFCLYVYMSAQGVGFGSVWWYAIVQMVSGSYGFWGPASFILITASFLVLLGVKRMRVVPIETLEVTDELSMLEPPIPRSRRRSRDSTRPPLSPWG